MRKMDKKIYNTADYKCYSVTFSVFFVMLIISATAFVTLGVIEKEVAPIITAVLFVTVLAPISIYYGYKLFSILSQANNFTYIEVSKESFSIDKSSLTGFRDLLIAIKVIVDGVEYVSERVLSMRDYASAEETKKLEIGISKENKTIVIVKPLNED